MKPPTFAPAYVGLFPILAEVAQAHGYALAVHGSVSRDFDLVAIPWIDSATDAETLIRAMAERVSYSLDSVITPDRLMEPPYTSTKPHGRRAWSIPLESAAVLDVSVVPRQCATTALESQVGNLAMFVKRMARVLGRSEPHAKLAERAFDYLRRNELEGSILRQGQQNAATTSDREAGE